jgi:hypothetical protein
MNRADHIALIREGVSGGTTWADLGSGAGPFTLALADLLGPGVSRDLVDRLARGRSWRTRHVTSQDGQ